MDCIFVVVFHVHWHFSFIGISLGDKNFGSADFRIIISDKCRSWPSKFIDLAFDKNSKIQNFAEIFGLRLF